MRKKLLIVTIVSFFMIFFTGCFHESTTLIDYPESKQELLDILDDYALRFDTLITDNFDLSEQTTDTQQALLAGAITYTEREDIEDVPNPDNILNGANHAELLVTADTIERFKTILSLCPTLTEHTFCDISSDEYDDSIQISYIGNRLTIESYRKIPSINGTSVYFRVEVDLMCIYIDDDLLHVEYTQEFIVGDSSYRSQYYCIYRDFVEDVSLDTIKYTAFFGYDSYEYRSHDLASGNRYFVQLHTNGAGFWMYNRTEDVSIQYTYDSEDRISNFGIVYGLARNSLIYGSYIEESVSQSFLVWSLFDVSGWNRAILQTGVDFIFLDETRVLEEFDIDIMLGEFTVARAQLTFPTEMLTASLLDLSNFGLEYTAIDYATLVADIAEAPALQQNALEDHGFSAQLSDNWDIFAAKMPYSGDVDIIQSLFEQMEEEQQSSIPS